MKKNKNRTKYLEKRKRETKNGKKIFFKNVVYPSIPESRDDIYVITNEGDRLDLLANDFYDDVKLWWVIAAANRDIIRRDSYALKPGLEIRIPHGINDTLEFYNNMNNSKFRKY